MRLRKMASKSSPVISSAGAGTEPSKEYSGGAATVVVMVGSGASVVVVLEDASADASSSSSPEQAASASATTTTTTAFERPNRPAMAPERTRRCRVGQCPAGMRLS
ncbi:MAG: hypothetical protein SGJ13_18320, partial [Actinomycetota bacterium]|nr:hypothetical protein [Actinomycetota bacterium]